jgi:carbon storage regulator
MLVITRRAGQSVHIGSDIVVEVREVRGKLVKLTITAPRDVPVLRREILASVGRRTQGEDSVD